MKPKKVIVPIKPTKKMIKAAQRLLIDPPAYDMRTVCIGLGKEEIEHLWALMLEARK